MIPQRHASLGTLHSTFAAEFTDWATSFRNKRGIAYVAGLAPIVCWHRSWPWGSVRLSSRLDALDAAFGRTATAVFQDEDEVRSPLFTPVRCSAQRLNSSASMVIHCSFPTALGRPRWCQNWCRLVSTAASQSRGHL